MMSMIDLDLARERREDQIRDAARQRLIGSQSTSLRRSIGRAIIRIGERMAAEQSLSLVRSR